ncbi:MAG: hypothetical protein K2M17_02450, partial [Bacilli bacterium]|nr:hypothetical protein [Bacilli bacterium]
NITSGTKYYQVRNTKNCVGMEEGIMTAVTNTFIKFDCIDTIGGHVIYKFSRAIYRGMSLSFEGMFTQMQGCHFVRIHPNKLWDETKQAFEGADNTNKTIYSYFKAAENVDDCPALTSASVGYFGNEDEETFMEQGLTKSVLSSAMVCDAQYTGPQGWITKADYNLSLFCPTAFNGGSISTHECAYLWNYGSWNNGDTGTLNSNGTPAKGRKCVNAVVVGCNAYVSCASARSVFGDVAVSHSAGYFAGRFSLPYLTF